MKMIGICQNSEWQIANGGSSN